MKNKGLNIALMVLGVGVAGFVVYKLVTGRKDKDQPKDKSNGDLGIKVTPEEKDEILPKTDISKLLQKLRGKPNVNVSELTNTKDSTM